ncbi:TIGR02647 family protein [Sulfuriferula sp. AH1]|uniref:TIGR02647 family protein n=1 Tax=Sulfuriferula sp. AH1 TaxID=1985873 RepID=UPI000B3B4DF7|nr:TIGR02647 family protein [Sulfuriferula sp. AH1]ARU30864.1 TIGR02647 family protein [Sulfuriferula sp. AH1]
MFYTQDLVDEMNALVRYDLGTTQQGVKVHKTADPAVIAATVRLFDKGLVTQVDGGYLTDLGREVAEHCGGVIDLALIR